MDTKESRHDFVTVVSGLPRTGTSMMMQALQSGGLPILCDGVREADKDNLRGYFELEAVKRTRSDPSWVAGAVGKAVKVIYMLLTDLPTEYHYRVLFMRRDLDEVVRSQAVMLKRRGQPGAEVSEKVMADVFRRQLAKADTWLAQQPNFSRLDVPYDKMILDPAGRAKEIRDFLGLDLDTAAMATAVDSSLYRQRRS